MSESPQLTELQLALMRILWDRHSATVVEITEELRPSRGLAQTTIATVLSRLEKRGIVRHETQSRQFVYYPTVTEPEVRHSMVGELTERLFAGDVAEFVTHLLSSRDVSAGEIAKVKAMIAARTPKPEEDSHARR